MLMTRSQFESYEAEFNGSADKSAFVIPAEDGIRFPTARINHGLEEAN